jgi:hypothetical protein
MTKGLARALLSDKIRVNRVTVGMGGHRRRE